MTQKKILLLVLAAFVLIPTGTPEDIVVLAVMKYLGWLYIPLVILLLFLLWHYKVTFEKAKEIVRKVFK